MNKELKVNTRKSRLKRSLENDASARSTIQSDCAINPSRQMVATDDCQYCGLGH